MLGCRSPLSLYRTEDPQILHIYSYIAELPQILYMLSKHQRRRACGHYCLILNSHASHKGLVLGFEV